MLKFWHVIKGLKSKKWEISFELWHRFDGLKGWLTQPLTFQSVLTLNSRLSVEMEFAVVATKYQSLLYQKKQFLKSFPFKSFLQKSSTVLKATKMTSYNFGLTSF